MEVGALGRVHFRRFPWINGRLPMDGVLPLTQEAAEIKCVAATNEEWGNVD